LHLVLDLNLKVEETQEKAVNRNKNEKEAEI
jgi:hypothetical protein